MSGRPPLTFSSTRRPPGRRWLRGLGIAAAVLGLVAAVWALVLGGLWTEAWFRLGGDEVEALRDEVTALGDARAPEDATTVLVTLTDSVDPTVPREPELLGPVALVQVGGPRDQPAVLLLPEELQIDVVDEGERASLADIQLAGGSDLLVRAVTDYTQVRVDHVASLSIDALPRLIDAVGPIEVCGQAGCDEPTGDELRSTLRTADDDQRVREIADVTRALGAHLDRRWAASSPFEVRRVVRALQDELATDASLRGMRTLEFADALSTPTRMDVDTLPIVVNQETDEVIELAEAYQVRFQHLQDGTPLEATAADERELRDDLLSDLTVAVLNGAGIDGLAAQVETQLETAGFAVIGTGNAPVFDREQTVVNFLADDDVLALGAVELNDALGGDLSLEPLESEPEFEDEPVDLLVIVGEDLANGDDGADDLDEGAEDGAD